MKEFLKDCMMILWLGLVLGVILLGALTASSFLDSEAMQERARIEHTNAQHAYQGKMKNYMEMCVVARAPMAACALAFGRGKH